MTELVRQSNADDINFVIGSSLQSIAASPEFSDVNRDIFFECMKTKFVDYMNNPDVQTLVYELDGLLLGLIICNPKLNHILYSYTKMAYRKQGINTSLMFHAFGPTYKLDHLTYSYRPQSDSIAKKITELKYSYNRFCFMDANSNTPDDVTVTGVRYA
jgi:hypothetical protein